MRSKKSYQFSFSKRQLIFVSTGVTFAFILVFILGLLVGSGRYENQLVMMKVEGLAKEERHRKEKTPFKVTKDLGKDPSDSELTFYETLLKKEGMPSQPGEAKTPRRTVMHGDQKKQGERGKKAFRKEVEKSTSLNGYTLQVGSFQSQDRAQKLVEKLRRKGYPAYIVSSNIPMKGVWHRVRTGHFQTLKEAKESGLALEMKERLPTYVTFVSK